jgi:arylamine N-acetyltransferase
MLHDDLLAAFLDHLALPTTGTPEQLLQAMLRGFARIPYENLTKIIAHAESSNDHHKQSPEEVIQGFIRYGTGGTCFPLTQTLVRFLKALGFEAAPILADRRYGSDTHSAVLVALAPQSWHVIDPGYLIHTPCLLPKTASRADLALRYALAHGAIELRPTDTPERVDLYTIPSAVTQHTTTPRYRLTYKTTPVDPESFNRAWERSFSWEMMTYPIVSAVINDRHIYLQKKNLLVRSASESTRFTVTADTLVSELAPKLGISAEVLRRALSYTEK